MTERKCELCGENTPFENGCGFCNLLSREQLVEQAHETISGWQNMLKACAVSCGGQIVVSVEQMMDAKEKQLVISQTPFREVRVNAR